MIPCFAFIATGCSGINSSHSVSPATFFLPGLLQSVPQPTAPNATEPQLEPVQQVAQVQ